MRAAPSSGGVINPRAAPSSGGVINSRAAPSSGSTEDENESYEEFVKNTSSLPFPAKGTVKSPEVDMYSTGGKKPPVFFSSPGGVRGWHRCLGSVMDQDVEPGSDQSFGSPAAHLRHREGAGVFRAWIRHPQRMSSVPCCRRQTQKHV